MDATDLDTRTGRLDELHREPRMRGQLDVFSERMLMGWAIDTQDPTAPVEISLYIDDVHVGDFATRYDRPDVSKALRLPVKAGFAFSFADVASDRVEAVVRLLKESAEGGAPLEGRIAARFRETGTPLVVGERLRVGAEDLEGILEILARKGREVERNFRTAERTRFLAEHPPAIARAGAAAEDVRMVAFYLPQYHPVPENDEWWGTGFTEWTNVTAAEPYFPEHHQPRRPADLGYYDLRIDAVHAQQVELAKRYGVSAFCYYYYWFSGKKLLEMPVRRHLEQDLDLDFCLCWANENWSRRWDGSEQDVLMSQQHSFGDDVRFIEEVLPYFASERYLKIDGAPLLLVYRISILSDAPRVVARWKEIVREAGYPDLHVSVCETFGINGPHDYGADSACQFPPHDVRARVINDEIEDLDPSFAGNIYHYPDVVANEIRRPAPGYVCFRAAMPAWDNTSRKGRDGNLFHNASPAMFEAWLSFLAARARAELPAGRRLVFVNAWNEWAEGAYLEPDRRHGHDNLVAVRNALSVQNGLVGELIDPDCPVEEGLRQRILQVIGTLQNANRLVLDSVLDLGPDRGLASTFVAMPAGSMVRLKPDGEATCWVDRINGTRRTSRHLTLDRSAGVTLSGWVEIGDMFLGGTWPLFAQLTPLVSADAETVYIAAIQHRSVRADVSRALGKTEVENHYNGFSLFADLTKVPPGSYRLAVLVANEKDARAVSELATPFIMHLG